MLKENEIYVIIFDYSTDDCDGVDVYLHKTKESALKKFKELIAQEIEFYKREYSHYDDFELDTNIDDEDCNEFWWNYKSQSNYYLHTFIDLKTKEIN